MKFKQYLENSINDMNLKIQDLTNYLKQNPTDLETVNILGDLYEDLSSFSNDRYNNSMHRYLHNMNYHSNEKVFSVTVNRKERTYLVSNGVEEDSNSRRFSEDYIFTFSEIINYLNDKQFVWICIPSMNQNFPDNEYSVLKGEIDETLNVSRYDHIENFSYINRQYTLTINNTSQFIKYIIYHNSDNVENIG